MVDTAIVDPRVVVVVGHVVCGCGTLSERHGGSGVRGEGGGGGGGGGGES